MVKRDLLISLTIFAVAFILSLPFLKPGLFLIHDDQQIARLFLFDKALKDGQLPVRWVDDLGFGFGYPLFVFYPPFVYMLGEIYHLLGFGFIDSTKLVFFTSIFASGIFMYIFAKKLWGHLAGLVSALFYMVVPYRALDIYVRGALAESFSFVWLPAILWSFYKLFETNSQKYTILAAILLALLMITHNLIFLPFMLLLPIYLLFLITISQNRKLSVVNCLLSIVLSLTLSAFFWIPALWEKKYTIVDQLLLVNLANYNIHFVYPRQLWNWAWGFGGSAAGLADGISFKIGKLHILVAAAAIILAIAHLAYRKGFKDKLLALQSFSVGGSTVFFALFIFAAFMTTFYSKFIWDTIQPLQYLQFPWRYLIFTALFSSSLSAAFVYSLRLPILKLTSSLFLLVLLIVPNFKLFKPQLYRPTLTDQVATSAQLINWDISQTSFEYLPLGVELYEGPLGTNLVKIRQEDIPKEKIEVENEKAKIGGIVTKTQRVEFTLFSEEPTKIKLNIFNFPGWRATINNREATIEDNNPLKLITLNAPAGTNQVTVEFKNTSARLWANFLTLVSLLLLPILLFKRWPILQK